MEQNPVEAGN